MDPNIPPEKLDAFLNQIESGTPPPNDDETKRLRGVYQRIRQEMNATPVWQIDRAALQQRLLLEAEDLHASNDAWSKFFNRCFVPAAVAACFLCLLYAGFPFVQRGPVESVVLTDHSSGERYRAPLFWMQRLRNGNTVTVPLGTNADVTLRDGSTLKCVSGTQIAVRFNETRLIQMRSGAMTVHAASDKNKPMVVKTPVTDVTVVGTVFHISLR